MLAQHAAPSSEHHLLKLQEMFRLKMKDQEQDQQMVNEQQDQEHLYGAWHNVPMHMTEM